MQGKCFVENSKSQKKFTWVLQVKQMMNKQKIKKILPFILTWNIDDVTCSQVGCISTFQFALFIKIMHYIVLQ